MTKTILVVDDEMLIALDIQLQLEELGHKALVAIGLAEAMAFADGEPVHAAIVDWHLRDALSAPLLELLSQRSIPFMLCSAAPLEVLSALFPAAPILMKPFTPAELVDALTKTVG